MEIVVTGASGFIGRSLCPTLEATGAKVRRAGRNITGDMGKDIDWIPIIRGASAVVHLAAHVHVPQRKRQPFTLEEIERFRSINVIASKRLAFAAQSIGVRRFILLSTAKVMGETSSRPLTSSDPVNPKDIYAQTKWAAERAVTSVSENMEVVILRSPLVYGPHVRGNFLRLMQLIERGIPFPFKDTNNLRSFIFVDNLSQAIQHSLHAPPGVYLPTDGEDLSTSDLIGRLANMMNCSPRLIAIPHILLELCTKIIDRHDEYQKLVGSLQLDGKIPGWKPSTTVHEGLHATVNWYKKGDKR